MYRQDLCSPPLQDGEEPLPCEAGDESRGSGKGEGELNGRKGQRRCVMKEFKVRDAINWWIVDCWDDNIHEEEVYEDRSVLNSRLCELTAELSGE